MRQGTYQDALLARAAISVPFGRVVESRDEAVQAFEKIGASVAVKSLDGNLRRRLSLALGIAAAE